MELKYSPRLIKRVIDPFFYDVTLRDGNQALRKPWNMQEKEIVFHQLVKMGVQGIEVGFASASESDFKSCEHLAKIVHTHNDLGMATATTVESYFKGVTQIETSLNGLGERAGNTNLYEVACALYNCGVEVDLNFFEIYSTATLVSQMSGIPIHEKSPLIGSDVFAHRSGIHQDGVSKTKHLKKSAYGAIDPLFIGRKEGHRITFTSQSGGGAIKAILFENGISISEEEVIQLQPFLKKYSDELGRDLIDADILELHKRIA